MSPGNYLIAYQSRKVSTECTVKPLLSGHLRDLRGTFLNVRFVEGVRLIEVVKIAQCLLKINI